jgi:hypothetical protein
MMRLLQVVLLSVAVAGMAFAADVVPVPEAGLDAPTVVGSIGLLAGGLLIWRARRK